MKNTKNKKKAFTNVNTLSGKQSVTYFVNPCKEDFMKFKKLSNNFWRCEFNGKVFVGTWNKVQEEIKNEN